MRSSKRLVLLTSVSLAQLFTAVAVAGPKASPGALAGRCAAVDKQSSRLEVQVAAALRAISVSPRAYSVSAKELAAARRLGIDEGRLLAWVRGLYGPLLCRKGAKVPPSARATLLLLGELGGARSFPSLLRLSSRGVYRASGAQERILTRLASAAARRGRCSPPSSRELAEARRKLADFVIIEHPQTSASARLRLRRPTAAELDDLAYLFVSVGRAGPQVGSSDRFSAGRLLARRWRRRAASRPSKVSVERRGALRRRQQRAARRGELVEALDAGLAYLETLGFPHGLRGGEERRWSWGGARYSYVMRDTALIAEMLGKVDLAVDLYRLANPGGGLCGTSAAYRWKAQLRGAIRGAERRGDCREGLAERLLEIRRGLDYGSARLTKAGFDVARILRGALLTRYRELKKARLSALAKRSGVLGARFLARLRRRGPEAWERRLWAVEGLADEAGKKALSRLLELGRVAKGELRRRALEALAKLAWQPVIDPCDPSLRGGFGFSSGGWQREVRSAGRSCPTSLRRRHRLQIFALARSLALGRLPTDRRLAAKLLGALALGRKILRRLAKDPYRDPNACRMHSQPTGKARCVPIASVKEAAQEALQRLDEHAEAQRRVAKRKGKKGG